MAVLPLRTPVTQPDVDSFTEAVMEAEELTRTAKEIENRLKVLREYLSGSKRKKIILESGFAYERYQIQSIKGGAKAKQSMWDKLPPKARFICFSPTKEKLTKLRDSGIISIEMFDGLLAEFGNESERPRFCQRKKAMPRTTLRKI